MSTDEPTASPSPTRDAVRLMATVSRVVRVLVALLAGTSPLAAADFYISPAGADANPGTVARPFGSLAYARDIIRASGKLGRESITVTVQPGVYYLPETLVFSAADSGTAAKPVVYRSAQEGTAVLSGGKKLELKWEPQLTGVYKAATPDGLLIDQLFINGVCQQREQRMVENLFDELDAPGKWGHHTGTNTLYCIPQPGVALASATVEIVRLRHLVEFQGTATAPVRFVKLEGFTFRHTARTFLETREPLLRLGAVLLAGTEDVQLLDCEFDQVGGNAVFVSNDNRRALLKGCHIHDKGASGVCFAGDPAAMRNPLIEYTQTQDLSNIQPTPGPKTDNYPAACVIEGQMESQASMRPREGGSLGNFRWLVRRAEPLNAAGENTAFQELAVQVSD